MNDRNQVEQLLQENGCTLIREGNHLIYRLPNGKNFVMAKTPSDFRSERNNLAVLRRHFNLREQQPQTKVVHGKVVNVAQAEPDIVTASPFERTLQVQIDAERARYDYLLDEAAKAERRIALLEVVSSFANDDDVEQTLKDVLGEPMPVYTPPAPLQLHSGPVTDRLHVTSPLVLAATHTFSERFTLNELVALMMGDRWGNLDPDEQRRIRSSVASTMERLEARGEVRKVVFGVGKRPAMFEKVVKGVLDGPGKESDATRGAAS